MEELIADRIRAARQAWPEVDVDDETVTAYVMERLDDASDVEAAVARANWTELYLLCACGAGDPNALAAFDEHYLSLVPAAVSHIALSNSDIDEISQRIREKLLVADGEDRPRIDQYAGAGSLHGLIKVIAAREAISIIRKRTREVWNPEDELLRLPAEMADPELDSAKRELCDHFRAAFEEAIDDLSARERNLLRMHVLEGVTLDQLGRSYAVHRVTITRWLFAARRKLLVATRQRLASRIGVEAAQLDSFLGIVESRLDLSLSRLLSSRRS